MKKIIFGIFAHPDDEAFGPCGTLLQEARSGTDIHLIMLTAGDAGTNLHGTSDLGEVRLQEWKKAGELLGTKGMHFLGYQDGHLDNTAMPKIAQQIAEIVTSTLADTSVDTVVEFMCFDFTGLSGHIDHIVASRAACLAFYRLQEQDTRLRRIRLFCLPASLYPSHNIDWLYKEAGCSEDKIDETIDARVLREEIIQIMRTHETQLQDCEAILRVHGDQLGLNHFVVKT